MANQVKFFLTHDALNIIVGSTAGKAIIRMPMIRSNIKVCQKFCDDLNVLGGTGNEA